VRDGRDVVLSMHPRRQSRSHVPPERWISDVAAGTRFEGHPRVLTVRYEDLVTEPEAQLRRTFEFLDEPFEPVNDSYVEGRTTYMEVDALGKSTHRRPPDRSSVGRWRDREDDSAVQALQRSPIAQSLLAHHGYL
jgi:hypothetical protein